MQNKIDRLVEIENEQLKLKKEKEKLESYFYKEAENTFKNSKNKTVKFKGSNANKVVITMSEKMKLEYPTYLKQILGTAYDDVVTKETKFKVKAETTRMLNGIYLNHYSKMTINEILEQLNLTYEAKETLRKKLKGANFETDKKHLMNIGGLDEEDAEQNAYFINEAKIWENFNNLMKINNKSDEEVEEIIKYIDCALVVEEIPRLKIESGD